MRKRLVSVLMIPLLLLAGCGARRNAPAEAFSALRERLDGTASLSALVRLTADTGSTAAEYALSLTDDGAETRLEITEPAILSGVTATVAAGQSELRYDGVILGAGPVSEDGLTPMEAPAAILTALREGYIELCWLDGDLYAARFYAGEGSAITVWLDPKDLTPVAAEVAQDGRTLIACRISEWKFTQTT